MSSVCSGWGEEVVQRRACPAPPRRPPASGRRPGRRRRSARGTASPRTAGAGPRRAAAPRSAPAVPDRQQPAGREHARGARAAAAPAGLTARPLSPPHPTCTCGRRSRSGSARRSTSRVTGATSPEAEQQEPQEVRDAGCPRSTRSRCAGRPRCRRGCASSSAASALGTDEDSTREHPVAAVQHLAVHVEPAARSRTGRSTVTSTKITSGSSAGRGRGGSGGSCRRTPRGRGRRARWRPAGSCGGRSRGRTPGWARRARSSVIRSSNARRSRETSETRDDRGDEAGADLHAVRALDDVVDGRVDEDRGDHREADRRPALPRPARGERHRHRGGGDQHQHAGGVGAALGVDVGVEDPGDQERRAGEHQHQRPDGAGPLRRHAVAGQVARDQVEHARPSPRRRRTRGSRWWRRRRRCRSRCRGTRAPGRPAPGRSPSPPGWNSAAGISSVVTKELVIRKTLMITAAVVSSRLVPRIRPRGAASVSLASPWTCGITATPVSKPDMPSASFGKTSSATADHHQRVAVLGGQRRRPVGHHRGVGGDVPQRRRR